MSAKGQTITSSKTLFSPHNFSPLPSPSAPSVSLCTKLLLFLSPYPRNTDPSMENSTKPQENQSPSLIPSPNSHSTTSSITTTTSYNNGALLNHHQNIPSPPQTSMPTTRSDPNNPYPTTFVQADTSSFKKVVQMLTGSSDTVKQAAAPGRSDPPNKSHIPPIRTGPTKKTGSKLYERRNSLKSFKISPLIPGLVNELTGSPRRPGTPEILSPSILDFPSLALSPVTPLIRDLFNRSPGLNVAAEEKAIAKKEFYLHPSPANTPRDSEPRLLPLFPVTSPRVSGSSDSS